MRSRVYVTIACPSVRPSVSLSHHSTAAAAYGGFAAERPTREEMFPFRSDFRLIDTLLQYCAIDDMCRVFRARIVERIATKR